MFLPSLFLNELQMILATNNTMDHVKDRTINCSTDRATSRVMDNVMDNVMDSVIGSAIGIGSARDWARSLNLQLEITTSGYVQTQKWCNNDPATPTSGLGGDANLISVFFQDSPRVCTKFQTYNRTTIENIRQVSYGETEN
jgi:hypothetical protein